MSDENVKETNGQRCWMEMLDGSKNIRREYYETNDGNKMQVMMTLEIKWMPKISKNKYTIQYVKNIIKEG